MDSLYSTSITTNTGLKKLEVYCCDVTLFDEEIDILTTSAFEGGYAPSPHTIFKALHNIGISVRSLSYAPYIDLRQPCHIWLSNEICTESDRIKRIGCVELLGYDSLTFDAEELEQSLINTIRAYFYMLDIASIYGVKMDTVALPLLGSGNQGIDSNLIIIPLLNECIAFLKRNHSVNRICFIEKNAYKAKLITQYVKNSHNINHLSNQSLIPIPNYPKAIVFISYSAKDEIIAASLCDKLESRGIQAWYSARDHKQGAYSGKIVEAIDNSTHFVVILSKHSMISEHVLNEIDLAFQGLPNKIKFCPLRVDETSFTPSFKYYLCRQQWTDAINPPMEARLNEFVDTFLANL